MSAAQQQQGGPAAAAGPAAGGPAGGAVNDEDNPMHRLQVLEAMMQGMMVGGGNTIKYKYPLPEPFDGSPEKLQPFLTAERGYQRNNNMRGTEARICHAIALLKDKEGDNGGPASWMQPIYKDYLENGEADRDQETNEIFESYTNFEEALTAMFGNPNEEEDAEENLMDLQQMGSALKYTVKFRTIASKTEFGNEALMVMYKRGLKKEIRREFALRDKDSIDTLAKMQEKAIWLDNQMYKQRLIERKNTQRNGANQKKKRQTPQHDDGGPRPMEVDKIEKKDSQKQNTQRGQRKKDPEQQRRFKEGLCLACGKKGHIKKDCTQKNAKVVEVKTIVTTPWKDPAILEVGPVHGAFTQEENEAMKLLKKGSGSSWECHPARDGLVEPPLQGVQLSTVWDLMEEDPEHWDRYITHISYVDDIVVFEKRCAKKQKVRDRLALVQAVTEQTTIAHSLGCNHDHAQGLRCSNCGEIEDDDPLCQGCLEDTRNVYTPEAYEQRATLESQCMIHHENNNVVTVAVVEVDGVIYDTDNEETIQEMLAKTRMEDDMEALHEQIDAELNPKEWEERESFYNTTRVKLNHGRELVIGEKEKEQMSHPQFTELRKWDWKRVEGIGLEGLQKILDSDREHRHWEEVVPRGERQQLVLYGRDIQNTKIEALQDDPVGQLERSKRRFREDNQMVWSKDDTHHQLSWIMCYDPVCRMHLKDKVNHGWFPTRKTYEPVVEVYRHEELQYWEITERHPGYARFAPSRHYPIMCVNGYVSWKQCQIVECKVHMRTKARKWWDDHERDQRIENMEYLVKPAGVYANDVHNFITAEEDEKAQQNQPEQEDREYPEEVPAGNW